LKSVIEQTFLLRKSESAVRKRLNGFPF